jgi:hypothetical protein
MYINLKLTKYFIEPENKYICFTTCLFEKKKYIRSILSGNKYIKQNLASNKKIIFIDNLIKINNALINGYYPDNFYLRLYYNDKIIKNEKYNDLLNILKENKKIQLIKYEVDNLFDPLIGTLIRFYTFFDNESKNIEYSICIDSDKFYNKKFIEIFNNFKKTNKLIYGISRLYYSAEHNDDYQDSNDFFSYITLIGNCIIVKKDKIFKKEYWDKYFNNMFKQNDLIYILNYNTFRKYTLNSIINNDINNSYPYYSFDYGIDELWINFVLKKILLINNAKDMLDIYLCDIKKIFIKNIKNEDKHKLGDIIKFFIRMKIYFNYNNIVNNNIFKYFIKDCTFLKIKSYDNLIKFINKLIYNFKNKNKDSVKMLMLFYKNIKQNKYLDLIYMNNNMKYIICNYKDLNKKVGKYLYGEFE